MPTPEIYTELLDAEVISETQDARKFMFGSSVSCWVPKSTSKLIGNRLFVARWLAKKQENQWKGVMVKGTQGTRMRALNHVEHKVTDVVPLIRQVMEDVKQLLTTTDCVLKILEAEQEQNEDELP